MTLKEIRELLKSGKPIQYQSIPNRWVKIMEDESVSFAFSSTDYRIAPEPKLRPWKPEEAIGKVVKHKKDTLIVVVSAVILFKGFAESLGWHDFQWYLENCECLDGSPCGVVEN